MEVEVMAVEVMVVEVMAVEEEVMVVEEEVMELEEEDMAVEEEVRVVEEEVRAVEEFRAMGAELHGFNKNQLLEPIRTYILLAPQQQIMVHSFKQLSMLSTNYRHIAVSGLWLIDT